MMVGFGVMAGGNTSGSSESTVGQFVARLIQVTPQDAGALTTLFTITGFVLLRIVAVCRESMGSEGAIALACKGYTGAVDGPAVLTAIADALDLDNGEFWSDGTLENIKALAANDAFVNGFMFGNATTIKLVPTGTFTAGKLDFYCFWTPLSEDGNVSVYEEPA